MERLDKVLSNLGYGTRKELKKICRSGLVEVNGEVAKDSGMQVDPENDKIIINGEEIFYRKFIYLMMNKPDGVVSATYDNRDETVIDLLEVEHQVFQPFPVGRLDKDTEGLLLITNDGQLAHQLLSPKKKIDKKYYVEVNGIVEDKYIEIFKNGVILDDEYKTLPADLEIIEAQVLSKVYLTIREGKFHQVKRMFKSQGMEVVFLKRISMGNLILDDSLKPGEYRELNEEEKNLLTSS